MQAGYSCMNCLTVIQTSQGLAQYLLESLPKAAERGVVIGYDSRHHSKEFAELAAAAFMVKGIKVWWYQDLVHTPLVPFGVKTLKAAAGIMITASHNPAQDNGYKVYGHNGCQIKSPADKLIAASILQNLVPVTWNVTDSHLRQDVLIAMKTAYYEELRKVTATTSAEKQAPRFVYTPMHGVGLRYMIEAMKLVYPTNNRESLDAKVETESDDIGHVMLVVEAQGQPDPDFPTVKYPNPEEKGALDLAMLTADKNNVKMILANDPDADRFAAAEKVGDVWHQFTGDQVGTLLGYYIFQKARIDGSPTMLISAVSSHMLATIAREEHFVIEECLTGFKWLGNRALEIGDKACFAYEEALGYMIPSVVYDKDGITAAVVFLEACSKWGSPWLMLESLYERYGYHETMNTYWRSPNVTTTIRIFERIRNFGKPYPDEVGGRGIIRWRDLTIGYDSATINNVPDLPTSIDTQMITCWLCKTENDEGIRFTVRASGTEPKIKGEGLCLVPCSVRLLIFCNSVPGMSQSTCPVCERQRFQNAKPPKPGVVR